MACIAARPRVGRLHPTRVMESLRVAVCIGTSRPPLHVARPCRASQGCQQRVITHDPPDALSGIRAVPRTWEGLSVGDLGRSTDLRLPVRLCLRLGQATALLQHSSPPLPPGLRFIEGAAWPSSPAARLRLGFTLEPRCCTVGQYDQRSWLPGCRDSTALLSRPQQPLQLLLEMLSRVWKTSSRDATRHALKRKAGYQG